MTMNPDPYGPPEWVTDTSIHDSAALKYLSAFNRWHRASLKLVDAKRAAQYAYHDWTGTQDYVLKANSGSGADVLYEGWVVTKDTGDADVPLTDPHKTKVFNDHHPLTCMAAVIRTVEELVTASIEIGEAELELELVAQHFNSWANENLHYDEC